MGSKVYLGVEPKIGGWKTPKMDGENYFIENPMKKWMIWGGKKPYFWRATHLPIHEWLIFLMSVSWIGKYTNRPMEFLGKLVRLEN